MRILLVVCLALVSSHAHAQAPARVAYDTTAFERDIRTRLAAFEGCQRDQLRVGEPTEGRVRIAVTVRTNGVNLAMRRASAEVRRCYEYALRNAIEPAGKIIMQFTILENGDVEYVQPTENTTGSDTLASCVATAIDRLEFSPGPVGGSVVHRYPFVFSPQN